MRRALCILALAPAAHAADIELSLSGRLLDAAGDPLNDAHDLGVALIPAATGGSAAWSDTFAGVPFADGSFTVVLGSGAALSSDLLLSHEALWVAYSVDGQALGPRQPLLRVPVAEVARRVRVEGAPSSTSCSDRGAIVFDTDRGQLRVCDGSAWRGATNELVVVGGARQWADGTVAESCEAYRRPSAARYEYTGATGSGAYRIQPPGGDAITVYCDQETDNGGWTLVMKQASGSGYGSPLSVAVWSGWGTPGVVLNEADATLGDANMVNAAWSRTVNSTPYTALSNANGNQVGNLGGAHNTPWPAGSFTDATWTRTTTNSDLCWRSGPWFNQTSFEYTNGGVKWGWMFNNECSQNTTDTAEGLGCCGNQSWYRASPWTLYLWGR
jgi:hypothetical protein